MKLNVSFWLLLIITAGILGACKPAGSTLPPSTNGLPLPQTVFDAVLVNFRTLTTTGQAVGAAWSPDGKQLAYTEMSVAPSLYSYRYSHAQQQTQVWVISADRKDGRSLDSGIPLFYSKDGSEIYYLQYYPTTNTPMVSAINPGTSNSRRFLGTQGFPFIYMLADGRLVLSEVGTYAPQRIFDPANGNRQALMKENPNNAPQDARLSPDGTLLAYPKDQAVYLSKPDGSNAKAIAEKGGFGAKVWWSHDSQHLVYTTGSSLSDKLVLADRQGKTMAVLFQIITQSGYISTVDWSPDNRWLLVTTDAIQQYTRATQLYLFDTAGNHKLLLESYETASPAWSPDGHTMALSLTNGPDADSPFFAIWLADLTDTKTAAALAVQPVDPMYQPTPTLVAPAVDVAPDQIVQNFWAAVNNKNYRTAYGMLTASKRAAQPYPEFKAFYDCIQQVSISSLQPANDLSTEQKVYSVKIDFAKDPDCNDQWNQAADFYTVVTKTPPSDPWQIECFNNTPDCVYNGP